MRRICLVGAVAVSSLAIGVAASSAKSHHHKPKPAPKPKPVAVNASCKLSMSIAVPAGESSVLADSTSGDMSGPISCSGNHSGVAWFPFTVADSGDIVGKMTAYYQTGSVSGAVDLTEPSSAPPTPYVFGNADFSGTWKGLKGTGVFAPLTGNGTFTCVTPDSIHYSCTVKVKGTLAPAS